MIERSGETPAEHRNGEPVETKLLDDIERGSESAQGAEAQVRQLVLLDEGRAAAWEKPAYSPAKI